MWRSFSLVLAFLLIIAGCAGESAKEKYDEAVKDLERAQTRLDHLRPAYDAARVTAMNAVCKEIAGTTPEESASAALAGLGKALEDPSLTAPVDAKAGDDAKKAAGKKKDELDNTIDNLIGNEKKFQEKQAAITAPVAKANEVMTKIKTPGTPEAKQLEEKLATMPEAQAYERQQNRVEKAQQEVDDLKDQVK
ncbi:MAG TPA: hypothetical protein VH107_20965 [Lacipirellulaceae bacterium]|jgi:hypothetical protein|nr:hypothetical protein [Lacipirellulaceae bacterium]